MRLSAARTVRCRGTHDGRRPCPRRSPTTSWISSTLLARRQLPDRRPDLPAGQPAAARAARRRAHQAAAARALGHVARARASLYAHLNRVIRRDRHRRDLPRRPRPRRSGGASPTSTSRARTPRSTRDVTAGRGGHAAPVPPVLDARRHPEPRERARRRARSTRAASSATRWSHAFGAAFDNPDLLVAARRRRRRGRDRTARGLVEGHPLPEPGARRRGAADPAPQRLQDRRPDRARPGERRRHPRRCSAGTATTSTSSRATIRRAVHQALAADARRRASARIRAIQDDARRRNGFDERPRWPVIVLRTPKGWTGPEGGRRRAGRGHVPRPPGAARQAPRRTPSTCAILEAVDAQLPPRGAVRRQTAGLRPELAALAPTATRGWARTRTPTAAGSSCHLDLPDYERLRRRRPDARRRSATSRPAGSARCCATSSRRNGRRAQLPPLLPGRDQLQPARRGVRGREPLPGRAPSIDSDDHVSPDGRVMEVLSEHNCRGLARGLPAHRPPRPVRHLRGVRHGRGVDDRAAHQVARARQRACRGARPIASLNVLLTSTCWRNDHNGFSHQGPGLIDTVLAEEGHGRPHLPAARRQLPALGGRPLPPQPRLRQPHRHRQAAAAAVARPRRGARALRAAASVLGLGRATSTPTTPTSCWPAPATSRRWRRSRRRRCCASTCPDLRVRVVNVVDLMALLPAPTTTRTA